MGTRIAKISQPINQGYSTKSPVENKQQSIFSQKEKYGHLQITLSQVIKKNPCFSKASVIDIAFDLSQRKRVDVISHISALCCWRLRRTNDLCAASSLVEKLTSFHVLTGSLRKVESRVAAQWFEIKRGTVKGCQKQSPSTSNILHCLIPKEWLKKGSDTESALLWS